MSQKKYNNPFFNESTLKVVETLFSEPTKEFHLRGISIESGTSTTATKRVLNDLQQSKVITLTKTLITSKITTNVESDNYHGYKKIFNLYQLERYGVIKTLKETYRAKTIVLFGSYARGEDIEGSDIDLLILTNHKKNVDLTKYEKKLNRSINLTILPSLEKSLPEFKNAVANGIVLHGYLKVL